MRALNVSYKATAVVTVSIVFVVECVACSRILYLRNKYCATNRALNACGEAGICTIGSNCGDSLLGVRLLRNLFRCGEDLATLGALNACGRTGLCAISLYRGDDLLCVYVNRCRGGVDLHCANIKARALGSDHTSEGVSACLKLNVLYYDLLYVPPYVTAVCGESDTLEVNRLAVDGYRKILCRVGKTVVATGATVVLSTCDTPDKVNLTCFIKGEGVGYELVFLIHITDTARILGALVGAIGLGLGAAVYKLTDKNLIGYEGVVKLCIVGSVIGILGNTGNLNILIYYKGGHRVLSCNSVGLAAVSYGLSIGELKSSVTYVTVTVCTVIVVHAVESQVRPVGRAIACVGCVNVESEGGIAKLNGNGINSAAVKELNVFDSIAGRFTGEVVKNSAVHYLNACGENNEVFKYGDLDLNAGLVRGIILQVSGNGVLAELEDLIALLAACDLDGVRSLGSSDSGAVIKNSNNRNLNLIKSLAVLGSKALGNLNTYDGIFIRDLAAKAVEVNVVNIEGGGRLAPAVGCTNGASLKVELNVVDTCIKLNALKGEFIIDTIKGGIFFVGTTAS